MEWQLFARVLENSKLSSKKQTSNKTDELFVQFRKENDDFEDLVSEREKIVRVMEIHSINLDALKTELEKWDYKINKEFRKLYSQYKKNSKRKMR